MYTPDKCANTSCAFPSRTCDRCLCNVTKRGKQALRIPRAEMNYQFCKLLFP